MMSIIVSFNTTKRGISGGYLREAIGEMIVEDLEKLQSLFGSLFVIMLPIKIPPFPHFSISPVNVSY